MAPTVFLRPVRLLTSFSCTLCWSALLHRLPTNSTTRLPSDSVTVVCFAYFILNYQLTLSLWSRDLL